MSNRHRFVGVLVAFAESAVACSARYRLVALAALFSAGALGGMVSAMSTTAVNPQVPFENYLQQHEQFFAEAWGQAVDIAAMDVDGSSGEVLDLAYRNVAWGPDITGAKLTTTLRIEIESTVESSQVAGSAEHILSLATVREAVAGRFEGPTGAQAFVSGQLVTLDYALHDGTGSTRLDALGNPLEGSMRSFVLIDAPPSLTEAATSAMLDAEAWLNFDPNLCGLVSRSLDDIVCERDDDGWVDPACPQCVDDAACERFGSIKDVFLGSDDSIAECIVEKLGIGSVDPSELPDVPQELLLECVIGLKDDLLRSLAFEMLYFFGDLMDCRPMPTPTPYILPGTGQCVTPTAVGNPPSVVPTPTDSPNSSSIDRGALDIFIDSEWPSGNVPGSNLQVMMLPSHAGGGGTAANSDESAVDGLSQLPDEAFLLAPDGTFASTAGNGTYAELHHREILSVMDSSLPWAAPYQRKLDANGITSYRYALSAGMLRTPSAATEIIVALRYELVGASVPGGHIVISQALGSAADATSAIDLVDALADDIALAFSALDIVAGTSGGGQTTFATPQDALAHLRGILNGPFGSAEELDTLGLEECQLRAVYPFAIAIFECLFDTLDTVSACKPTLVAGPQAYAACVILHSIFIGGGAECVADLIQVKWPEMRRRIDSQCNPTPQPPVTATPRVCLPTTVPPTIPVPSITPVPPVPIVILDYCVDADDFLVQACREEDGGLGQVIVCGAMCSGIAAGSPIKPYCDGLACNCQNGHGSACAEIQRMCDADPSLYLCQDIERTCASDPSHPICAGLP